MKRSDEETELHGNCTLQWRHCGLVNALAKTKDDIHVRIEGLWIG